MSLTKTAPILFIASALASAACSGGGGALGGATSALNSNVKGSIAGSFLVSEVSPSAAPAGALVKIMGVGLTEGINITFGGVPATVTERESDQAIFVAVPEGTPGMQRIEVAKGGEKSSMSFLRLGTADQAVVAGALTQVCKGEEFYDIDGNRLQGTKDCMSQLSKGAVTADSIAPGAVGTEALAAGSVTTPKLAAGAVVEATLAEGSVTAPKLAAGAVVEATLADGSVTAPKLAAGAVGVPALADAAVTTPKLAAGAVTEPALGDAAVTTSKLADAAVTTPKLAAGAVTELVLSDAAVTSAKIAPGAVKIQQLGDMACAATQLLKWNGTTWYCADDVGYSGPAGAIDNVALSAGAVTTDKIRDGEILNEDISDSAAIADTKLATIATPGKVDGGAVTSGTIGGTTELDTAGKLATSAGLELKAAGGVASSLKFHDGAGTHWLALNAPATMTGDVQWELPGEEGLPRAVLSTNGAGVWEWRDLGSAADYDVGTGPDGIVQLDANSRLPAVDGSLLTNLIVDGAEIVDNSLTAADIGPAAVGNDELIDSAVSSSKIADKSIVAADVADDTLTAAQLAPDSVGASEIAAGAVTTGEILDGTIRGADVDQATTITVEGFVSTKQGAFTVQPEAAGVAGELRFVESNGGSQYIGLKAPDDAAATKVWILPANTAADNQVLRVANAATGQLDWSNTISSITTGSGLAKDGVAGGTFTTTGQLDLDLDAAGGLSKTLGTGGRQLGIAADGIVTAMIMDGQVTSAKVADGTILGADIDSSTSITVESFVSTKQSAFTVQPEAAGVAGELRFVESNGGSQYIGLKAPDDAAATKVWILPADTAADNQVLRVADAATGQLDWSDTISSITTGQGLLGGPITTTGQIDLDLDAAGGLSKTLGGGSQLGVKTDGIVTTMIKDGQVTSAKILDATIVTADIAADAVTSAEIAPDTIVAADIATGAVGTAEIVDGTILGADVDSSAVLAVASVGVNTQSGFLLRPFAAAAGATSELRFFELAAGGANYVGFKAPDAVTANRIWTLPDADGAANAVLKTDGNGILGWATSVPPSGAAGGSLSGSYPNPTIAANAVTTAEIAADTITALDLAAGAVETAELADSSVTSVKIAPDTITAADIATDAVTSAEIANDAVGNGELATDAVTNAKVADAAINTAELADNSVTTAKIAADTITALDIAADAVTASEIAAGAVDTVEIKDGAVTTAKLAVDAITNTAIAPDSIGNSEMQNDAIGSNEIIDGSITGSDISSTATLSVRSLTASGTSAAPGAIVLNPYSPTLPASGGELHFKDQDGDHLFAFKGPDAILSDVVLTLPATAPSSSVVQVLGTPNKDSNLGWVSSLPPNGEAGGSLAGTYPNPTIAANAVTTTEIAADTITAADIAASAVGNAELAANAVTTSKISDGTILDADIAGTAQVATSKLSGAVTAIAGHGLGALATMSAVGATEIADSSVTSLKIADSTIVNADISGAAAIDGSKLASASIPINRLANCSANQVLKHTGMSWSCGTDNDGVDLASASATVNGIPAFSDADGNLKDTTLSYNTSTNALEADAIQLRALTSDPTCDDANDGHIWMNSSSNELKLCMGKRKITLQAAQNAPPTTRHIMFVTSRRFNGAMSFGGSSGLAAADAICTQSAKAAGLPTNVSWKAVLTVSGTSLGSRINISYDVYNTAPTPQRIATQGNFFSTIIWHETAARYDEFGLVDDSTLYVWTGTNTFFNGDTNDCSDWTSNSSSIDGAVAAKDDSGSGWIKAGISSCDIGRRLYCISQ